MPTGTLIFLIPPSSSLLSVDGGNDGCATQCSLSDLRHTSVDARRLTLLLVATKPSRLVIDRAIRPAPIRDNEPVDSRGARPSPGRVAAARSAASTALSGSSAARLAHGS